MFLTGDIQVSLPKTQNLAFEFNNLLLVGGWSAVIGFSGQGYFPITLTSDKVYDNSGLFIWGYDKPFNLSGIIQSGQTQLFINGEPLVIKSGVAESYNTFFVQLQGEASGLQVNTSIYTPPIPITFTVNPIFLPGGDIEVTVTNASTMDVTIFDYQLEFTDNSFMLATPPFSGQISGVVSGNSSVNFSLLDVSTRQDNNTYAFNLLLDTNIGQVGGAFSTTQVSGFNYNIYVLEKLTPDPSIPILFYGQTGLNSFVFDSTSGNGFTATEVTEYSLLNPNPTGEVFLSFYPVSPTGAYSHQYVTGFNLSATGFYDSCPQAEFTQYFYVNNFISESNTILSSGCTGIIKLGFSGISGIGTGASGYLYTNPQLVTDTVVYGTSLNPQYYFVVTGFDLTNEGSGYTAAPSIYLDLSQAGAGCFDYALASGNQYPYSSFSGVPVLGLDAGYLTGWVECESTGTGYYVTGIIFTNPGSGYSSTFYPTVSFIRNSGDTATGDASGTISLNSYTGVYNFASTWSITTGYSSMSTQPISGSGIPFSGETQIYCSIALQPIDYTGIMVAGITISGNGTSVTSYITGYKVYSTNPLILTTVSGYFNDSSSILNFLNEGLT